MKIDPDWKIKEKLVTIIERHIGQNAVVKHDQNLQVLTSKSGRTRQCDLVIVEGAEPRQTISIVEVQRRGSKPTINDFEGWVTKMQQVGAQHLICVSELGFPASIEERADELGPTVRLLTLQQVVEGQHPLASIFHSQNLRVVRYDKLDGLQMEYQHLVRVNPSQKDMLPGPFEKVFRVNEITPISVSDIMDWHFFATPKNIEELPLNQQVSILVKFEGELDGYFEHMAFDGKWVKLRSLLVNFRLHVREEPLTWGFECYQQVGWGEIGWVAKASTTLHGEPFHLVTPIRRVGPGEYSFGRPVTLTDDDAFIALGNRGFKATRYTDA